MSCVGSPYAVGSGSSVERCSVRSEGPSAIAPSLYQAQTALRSWISVWEDGQRESPAYRAGLSWAFLRRVT